MRSSCFDPSNMTPDLIDRLVVEVESAIGEPVRHTIRKLLPKKLDRSIADEVELAGRAPRRRMMLCNPLSRPNQVIVTANRFPSFHGAAYPADYGVCSIEIGNTAPRALDLLLRLANFAALSGAFRARADSPVWRESRDALLSSSHRAAESLSTRFRFAS